MKIIAESAFNHNGDIEYLKDLAIASKNSGADYFTVQIMSVDSFCESDYAKYKIYKNTEISKDDWLSFFSFCETNKINLIPCILEEKSLDLIIASNFKLIKIHATDITNKPFLSLISKYQLEVILETQCATIFEIEFAIKTIGIDNIHAIFTGFSNYPTEIEDTNLGFIDHLRNKFKTPVGFADHSLDALNLPLMVLAKGCDYIEKHITLTRNNRNFDYQVSLYPNEFSMMVSSLKHYSHALGRNFKHPDNNEKSFRSVMYKKVINDNVPLLRSDKGEYFIEKEINSFSKDNTVVAIIARLKSKRLREKVLRKISKNEMIIDLYERISKSNNYKPFLATSDIIEDQKLIDLFTSKNFNYFKGDPTSVIDRMISLAFENKAAYVFRVTGDNPFTDPSLMNEMLKMIKEFDLDYVKTNNFPFGIGPELFSLKYLWQLYLRLETTEYSEYLTWYVLNDKTVRMGSIDSGFDKEDTLVNLSVDYENDLIQCQKLYDIIGKNKFHDIELSDIMNNLSKLEKVETSKTIKLPNGTLISFSKFLKDFENASYIVRKKIKL